MNAQPPPPPEEAPPTLPARRLRGASGRYSSRDVAALLGLSVPATWRLLRSRGLRLADFAGVVRLIAERLREP